MSLDTIEYLRNIPPFKDLSQDSFNSIEPSISHVEFPDNILIIEEGAKGDSLYIIKKGSVQVYINAPDNDEKIILSKLEAGDYFGEMALITGEPRSASVETLTPVSLLRLDKEGFNKILEDNPSISLSLSHMLSQRLKHANLQRAESEKLHHAKIAPSGSLRETPFFEVLKFCEQNSLSGALKLIHDDESAEIMFKKGNVQTVTMADLSEDEAMDRLMQWEDGTFTIEPQFFSLDESLPSAEEQAMADAETEIDALKPDAEVQSPATDSTAETETLSGPEQPEEKRDLTTEEVMVYLLDKLLNKLIAVVGSHILKDNVAKSLKELQPFFPVISNFNIKVVPQVHIEFTFSDTWDEKKTLAVAVFLQTVLKSCQPMIVGMGFLDIKDLAGPYGSDLEDISFFDYMKHADEFAV